MNTGVSEMHHSKERGQGSCCLEQLSQRGAGISGWGWGSLSSVSHGLRCQEYEGVLCGRSHYWSSGEEVSVGVSHRVGRERMGVWGMSATPMSE